MDYFGIRKGNCLNGSLIVWRSQEEYIRKKIFKKRKKNKKAFWDDFWLIPIYSHHTSSIELFTTRINWSILVRKNFKWVCRANFRSKKTENQSSISEIEIIFSKIDKY